MLTASRENVTCKTDTGFFRGTAILWRYEPSLIRNHETHSEAHQDLD